MTLYDDLNISSSASPEEIKAAYRVAAKINHPDKGGDAERFKTVAAAYAILSNPEKKKHYDRTGEYKEKTIEIQAMTGLAALLSMLIDEEGVDNPISQAQSMLFEEQAGLKRSILSVYRKRKLYLKRKKGIKATNQDNLFIAALNTHRRGNIEKYKECKKGRKVFTRMQELLADYSYTSSPVVKVFGESRTGGGDYSTTSVFFR